MSRTTHPIRSTFAAGAGATLAVVAAIGLPVPARAAAGSEIPARPEQLQFPVRRYEPPRAADARVKVSNGMVAYLVADRTLPIVTVNVLMRIGPDLDPPGREGLAQGMVHLLTRGGTASRGAKQVEDRVAFLGAQLESQMGGGGGGMFGAGAVPIGPAESRATLNLLSKDLDEGLALLVECLKSPAFEAERLKLWKDQQLQAMKQRNDESASIEEREWAFLMRGDGHWSTRYPTAVSVEAVTRDDLAAFHRRTVGPKNFILSISGDFDRAAMIRTLEKAFAKWPGVAERPGPPPAPPTPAAAGWFMVDKDVNQGRVSIGLRALDRYDPDYQAARVMNDILGGGGFTSRLVNRIRSDEGLAYSVGSQLQGGTYYPDAWRIGFQTKVRSVAFAIQIALGEVQRVRDSLVTAGELEVTKNKFIEALPAQFETAVSIANALAVEELTGRYGRDPGYYAEYRERVGRVTAADVQRVARRLLDPSKLAVLVVGKADDMLLGDPKREARLTTLAGGEPRRLPLRDPLTMKPIPAP